MQLRVMGVRIGIDDFGTGHSSFAYLHQFPADFLKIDKSFVRGIEVNQDKADIVGTIAGLARQLGLRVIAEGVESESALSLIRSRQCQCVQGFLFSRPVDADAAADLLRGNGVPLGGAPGAGAEGPPADAETGPHPTRVRLQVGLAAVALLAVMGSAVRFTSGPAVPAPPPAASAAAAAAQAPSVAAPPVAVVARPPDVVEDEPPAKPAAEPSPPKVTPRPRQAAPLTFAVKHQHVFGGCQGTLRVSRSGMSFASDNAKDSFALAYDQFQAALGSDTLVIRSDEKTYRFRSADPAGKDENLSQLRKAVTAIDGFRPK
jgi:hypothetical protein